MMLLNVLLALYIVYADVIREDGYHNYEGQFTVKHKGRMLRVLMSFRNVEMEECALNCVRHLRCRTYNYLLEKKDCELTDEDFDEMDVDTFTHGWYNYGTPTRVNGGWSSWKNFTECSETCGDGTIEQWRDCNSPKPEYGGANCKGRMRRRVKCYIRGCPVNGGLSDWKNATECSKPCGNGTLEQLRECDSPKPEYGGANCTEKGKRKRIVECNTHVCPEPVNGGWSSWTYHSCSKTCGRGTKKQWRHCDLPAPKNGGADCIGKKEETVECNNFDCPAVNVALWKAAKQSSTSVDDNSASKAVDGSLYTTSCTNYDVNPWWEIDLGELRMIKNISFNANLQNFRVNRALLIETRKEGEEAWTLCKNISDREKKILELKCNEQSTKAQYLRIRSTEKCTLCIYEVKIFGY